MKTVVKKSVAIVAMIVLKKIEIIIHLNVFEGIIFKEK